MIPTTRKGEEYSDKQENGDTDPSSNYNTINVADLNNSSSAWIRSKDPRIVRVSRAFGGKDRHSKVCTIRGLRDRRVRLTVPTAIDLYNLQARLGVNQPSKVVDWLLNVAKDDINELPPLQIPPGFNFMDQAHQAMLSYSSSHYTHQHVGSSISNMNPNREDASQVESLHKPSFWTSSQPRSTKSKDDPLRESLLNKEAERWTNFKQAESDQQDDAHKLVALELRQGGMLLGSSSNFFPRNSSHSLVPNLYHSASHGSYYHFDYPSNSSLSSSSSQSEAHHHNLNNGVALDQSASMSAPSSGPHGLLCLPGMAPQSYFPLNVATVSAASMEVDPKQFINHFQLLSSTQHQDALHMSLDDVNKRRS